jgi:hypothetical protein
MLGPAVLIVVILGWFDAGPVLSADGTIEESSGDARGPMEKSFGLGPVQATLRLEPAQPVIGDSLTLTLTVVAEEDVELLLPEFGEALERFTILDFVPRQTIDDQGRTVATQTYRLEPSSSGPQAIPPILVEFVDRRDGQQEAPEGQDAYELLTERFDFDVRSVLPDDAQADLKPPMGKLQPLRSDGPSAWPWIVGGALMAACAVPLAYLWFASWRRRVRRRSAYEVARARLNRLLSAQRPVDEQVDAFYVELSGIVRRYLEDRFDMRAPELTTEEFLASVGNSPDLSPDHQFLLREFLKQADLVKFAGFRPSPEDIDRSVRAAERFLDETRDNAPLIEVDDDPRPTVSSHAAVADREAGHE